MIVGIRPRTILGIPFHAMRVLKAAVPTVSAPKAERKSQAGLLDSFERMMSHQADRLIRQMDEN